LLVERILGLRQELLLKEYLVKLEVACEKNTTSRKKAFIVGSERRLSSVLELTLTQETLIQTSVEELTSHSSPQRRLIPDNRRGSASGTFKHKNHHVGVEPKHTWCREPQRRGATTFRKRLSPKGKCSETNTCKTMKTK